MKVSIIGCGSMGSGIARCLVKNHQLFLYDHTLSKAEELAREIQAEACSTIDDAVKASEVIFLAVKPKDLEEVADSIQEVVSTQQVLISILSGISYETLKQHFGKGHLVRMMPNLAVMYGKGVVGLAESPDISDHVKKQVEALCAPLGFLHWFSEDKLDAITSLTGSGPAFMYVIVETMVEAGIAMGLSPSKAKELVLQMLEGTLTILNESQKHPAELKWQVTSPGGTTIAGLQKMEEAGVRNAIMKAFLAAYHRAKEMGK
jgi:pyrroline-5-carboxylate reductase